MDREAVCESLEWDSEFFGLRIARVKSSRITQLSLSEIDSWCQLHKTDCLYFLADSQDQETARLAQESAFRFVDARVTFELSLGRRGVEAVKDCATVRNAHEHDIPALRAIARCSHRDSRFYFDGNFPETVCNKLYETWIDKSCRGWANNVLVTDAGGGAEGYITCHLMPSGAGQIGLVGVAKKARGHGVGGTLLAHALRWFAQNGSDDVTVVTQGRNVAAQRLYQKSGFATKSVETWFHRWFKNDT